MYVKTVRRTTAARPIAFVLLAFLTGTALAQAAPVNSPTPTPISTLPLDAAQTIEVSARHYNNAVGSSDAASQGVITAELLKSRPAQRPGEVLEFVPGLIVTQHSGDGKANQYFLRGFNLDHGTDFATSVAGVPVNMPTHGHGQGYTDLNFMIPELVQRIDYRKGPYFASTGDFSSAGSADIIYRNTLGEPFAQLTLGGHGYQRAVLGGSKELVPGLHVLSAIEIGRNDGPWTVPERLRKASGVVTLSAGTAAQGWSTSLMNYSARWTSTDQVPQRLIDAGSFNGKPFGAFDSLDPSDGGQTTRASWSGEWHRTEGGSATRVSAYAMHYGLTLWSNFTYALDRPSTGDQFSQRDDRRVLGLRASHALSHELGGLAARSEVGLSLREDHVRVGLFETAQRLTIDTTRDDQALVRALGVYGQTAVELLPSLRAVLGLRADQASNRVDSLTLAANSGRAQAALVSPKFSLVAGPFAALPKTEFFFNAGRGLHSNDARGTTTTQDPKTGDPVDRVPALVASRGFEVGARTEAIAGLQSSVVMWALNFNSELVYVGDAGATQASLASRRRGLEWNNRYVPVHWFLFDADLAWTHARFANGERIPNAIDKVASLAATLREMGPWSVSWQWRYLGTGALVEDNSVRAKASLTSNLRFSRKLGALWGKNAEVTLDVFNLRNSKVDDIQYFYASKLPSETAAVADRHVHPAEPRSARLTFQLSY